MKVAHTREASSLPNSAPHVAVNIDAGSVAHCTRFFQYSVPLHLIFCLSACPDRTLRFPHTHVHAMLFLPTLELPHAPQLTQTHALMTPMWPPVAEARRDGDGAETQALLQAQQRQEFRRVDEELQYNEVLIEERDEAIQEISQQIGEVHEIFQVRQLLQR